MEPSTVVVGRGRPGLGKREKEEGFRRLSVPADRVAEAGSSKDRDF